VLTRSRSSDALSPEDGGGGGGIPRDVSVGEELNEGAFAEPERKLVKTHSFDAGSSGDLPDEISKFCSKRDPSTFAALWISILEVE